MWPFSYTAAYVSAMYWAWYQWIVIVHLQMIRPFFLLPFSIASKQGHRLFIHDATNSDLQTLHQGLLLKLWGRNMQWRANRCKHIYSYKYGLLFLEGKRPFPGYQMKKWSTDVGAQSKVTIFKLHDPHYPAVICTDLPTSFSTYSTRVSSLFISWSSLRLTKCPQFSQLSNWKTKLKLILSDFNEIIVLDITLCGNSHWTDRFCVWLFSDSVNRSPFFFAAPHVFDKTFHFYCLLPSALLFEKLITDEWWFNYFRIHLGFSGRSFALTSFGNPQENHKSQVIRLAEEFQVLMCSIEFMYDSTSSIFSLISRMNKPST